MKTMLRIAAVLSFGFCFAGGLILAGIAASSAHSDSVPIAAMGFVLIGAAIFAGAMIWLFVEKCFERRNDKQ